MEKNQVKVFTTMTLSERVIRSNPEPGIEVLTINRPESLNSLNSEVLSTLEIVIDQIESDARKPDGPKVLVITGSGSKAFVAGADIYEMSRFDSKSAVRFSALGHRVFNKIESLSIPVIAAVNGYALGGGCELALACDLIICSEKAVFGLPEVSLGLIPGFGGTVRLRERVGLSKAKELIFTAKKINANEAFQIGLVNRVEPEDHFQMAWLNEARLICSNSRAANKAVKRLMNESLDQQMHTRFDAEMLVFGELFGTPEQKEGVAAFLEKRKPNF